MARDDGRQETEDERRARKERERLKREKGKAPAEAKPELKTKGGLPPVGEGENRLHRDTPFLCDFRFRTPLPPPPVGAKLLPVAVDRGRMAAYRPYNLWWDRPAEMPLELDLGISLDPLDVEQYRVPPGGVPPLHPADEALLAGGGANGAQAAGPGFRAGRTKPGASKAGWLMRTLYLSDMQLPKGNADENAHARALKERQLAAEGYGGLGGRGRDARAEQAAAIEASFAAVSRPPVHATNPSLTAVEVLPVLPDFERWPDSYVHLQFDQDPLSELPYVPPLPPPAAKGKAPAAALAPEAAALRDAACAGAFMKSYSLSGADGAPPEKIIVYFAPTEAEARRAGEALAAERACTDAPSGSADGAAVAAEWVREFSYETRDEAALLVLFMGAPRGGVPVASYVPVHKRVVLRRRAARVRDGGALDVARPESVTLRRRKRTEDEEEAAAAAKRALTAPEAYDEEDDRPRAPTPPRDVDDDDDAVAAAPGTAAVQHAIFGGSSDEDD